MQDKILDLGTDVAGFFLFHPDDLEHRKNDPIAWYSYDFACGKEFEAGRLIAFYTGSDGGYRFRITEGPLAAEEQHAEAGSWPFFLVVRHGRVFLDNSDGLPGEEQMDQPEELPDQWIEVPNGEYQVTVHALDRSGLAKEAAEALPDYVIRFEPLRGPVPFKIPTTPPEIPPVRGRTPTPSSASNAERSGAGKETDAALKETYPLLEASGQFVVPGFDLALPVPREWYEALDRGGSLDLFGDEEVEVVLAPDTETPGIATLVRVTGSSQRGDTEYRAQTRGVRLVRVTERIGGGTLPRARVEAVTLDQSAVAESEISVLKEAFAAYARTNADYRKSVSSPGFEADSVGAMQSGERLLSRLIHDVILPWEPRRTLLTLPRAEQTQQLLAILQQNAEKGE